MKLEITQFHKNYIKGSFKCKEPSLDNYIKTQASQDIKKGISACFVLLDNTIIKGYYTLSSNSLPIDIIPSNFAKKFPKSYPNIPVTLLGRLAVDQTVTGKGYGESLLFDALKRSHKVSKTAIGSFAIIVDPISDQATSFYKQYGFIALETGKMFLPMKEVEKLFI